MNILVINHYAGSSELGMEFRPYYMSREWVKQGHNVLIVGATYSHLRKQQPIAGSEKVDDVVYYWIKTNRYKGNGIGRVFSMFLFVFKLLFTCEKLWKDFHPDIVIASSTYPLDIFPARKIAKRYNAKLVFEVHDLWPLSPIELGGYSKVHPFIVVMQIAENYAYKYCDWVISLLPNALEHMKNHGLCDNKFIYVPNGFDETEWANIQDLSSDYISFFENLRRNNKRIIGYAGGHAKSNALDFLIDAMKLVKDKDFVCVIVGKGQEKERLMNRVKKEQIDNIFFLEAVYKLQIPSLLKQMDILYIGWENNPLYRFGISPNKLIDYMMASKPIIHSVNTTNDWVKEYECGISVSAESPEEIAQGIECVFSLDDETLSEMGKRGLEFASRNLSYTVLAKKIMDKFLIK